MGNSESSSSQFPPGKYNDDGESSNRNKKAAAAAVEEEDDTFLKIGAAVAGTALLAFGALKLATSSSSTRDDDRDERVESATSYGSRRGAGRSAYFQSIGNTNQYISPKMIKIMSYNVWSKDVETLERMKSISSLVLKHSPDVILFQEITPKIYKIFESFDWWHSYECSVSAYESRTKNFFPMLLSKLPVEILDFKELTEAIGKEIIVAKICLGLPKELYVAAIHLKSPAPSQMHSEERTAQAEKAIKNLNSATNIVFGGDMNWDDDIDGPFPLLDGWVDAWSELRDDDEHGWTFDTRANPMLKGYKPLQKRLDRFMCKLRDFRLYNVEMIGLEAIPDFNSRNIEGTLLTGLEAIPDLHARNIKGKMAPVLPSDHFGLILTIKCLK